SVIQPAAQPDTVPPTAPSALQAAGVGQTSMTMSWAASSDNVGVTGYRVFRDGTPIGSVATTSFALSGLSCGTSYTLGVAAVDAAGNTSATTTTSASTAACADTTAPSAPQGLTASSVGSNEIDLSWNRSTDNVG